MSGIKISKSSYFQSSQGYRDNDDVSVKFLNQGNIVSNPICKHAQECLYIIETFWRQF